MSKLIDKIKDTKLFRFINKLYHDTRIRFIFVGALNTVIGLVVDSVVCFLFQNFSSVASEIYLVIGSVSGTVLGAINSYFWNKYFTFQSKKKSLSELIRFIIVYVVCFLFSYFAQLLCLRIFGYEEESIYFYIAKVCVLVVQVFLSWFGQRYFCFRKEKSPAKETADNAVESSADKGSNESSGTEQTDSTDSSKDSVETVIEDTYSESRSADAGSANSDIALPETCPDDILADNKTAAEEDSKEQ